MANKDHSLDFGIILAAENEFMRCGYEKASLRKIAAAAGVTIGAIYTRYHSKDSLFCSLVQPLLSRIEQCFGDLKQDYYQDHSDLPISSMQKESDMILHLIFDDYDRAVLLLCRSRGSSLEHYFDVIVNRKIKETLEYFKTAQLCQLDEPVLKLLIQGQFQMYFQIVKEGYDLETAQKMMNEAICYHTGGWIALIQNQSVENQEDAK